MVSILKTDKIQASHGSTVEVSSGHKISGAAGSIVTPGQVIQVQHANFTSQISTTSSTIAATGIQMNFTPHIATSKLLVRFNIQGVYNASASSGWNFYVYRDGSAVTEDGLHSSGMFVYAIGYAGGEDIDEVSNEVLLSANNTNQTLIALYGRIYNTGTSYINVNAASGDRSFMTIMEIAQ